MMCLFSIIVPVYQDIHIFSLFWKSLLPSLHFPTQVILINDASSSDTGQMLRDISADGREGLSIFLMEHEKSLGYAQCVNEALDKATGRYVVTMDSDLIVTTEDWQRKVKDLLTSPTVGGVGSVLLYPQTGGIQCAGLTYTLTVGRHLFLNARPDILRQSPYAVQATVFAFFATKNDVIQRVGRLDTCFFNGYEDIDYQMRIRRLGLQIMIAPDIQNFHWEQSNGKFRDYGRRSNLALLWKKHGDIIHEDLCIHMFPFLQEKLNPGKCYDRFDLCSTRSDACYVWRELERRLPEQLGSVYEFWHGISGNSNVNLSTALPFDAFQSPRPFLILCDHFICLLNNSYWVSFRTQYCKEDIIIDLYGNVLTWEQLQGHFWPGWKIR